MARSAAEILKDTLALPPEARAEIADALFESLDDPADQDVERAWSAEIARRMQQIDAGEVQLVTWSEARRITLTEDALPNLSSRAACQ